MNPSHTYVNQTFMPEYHNYQFLKILRRHDTCACIVVNILESYRRYFCIILYHIKNYIIMYKVQNLEIVVIYNNTAYLAL